jgi:hypothetical protein
LPAARPAARSSDPAASDDSGWNLSTFATQGTGDMTRGAQFSFSTVGFASIVFGYDLRHSNSSAANGGGARFGRQRGQFLGGRLFCRQLPVTPGSMDAAWT